MRKAPTQQRAQATVQAILQAAAHILGRRGWMKFTTNEVAEAAGVSIGSLYPTPRPACSPARSRVWCMPPLATENSARRSCAANWRCS